MGYEGGMDLNDSDGNGCGHLGVVVRGADMHLTVSTFSDRTSTQVVAGLTLEEIDEAIGMLRNAKQAMRVEPNAPPAVDASGRTFSDRPAGWTAAQVGHVLGERG